MTVSSMYQLMLALSILFFSSPLRRFRSAPNLTD